MLVYVLVFVLGMLFFISIFLSVYFSAFVANKDTYVSNMTVYLSNVLKKCKSPKRVRTTAGTLRQVGKALVVLFK